jgi:hypothetical protein
MATTKIHEQPTPTVGMGATSGAGSDRYPYTVVEILSHRRIVLQRDSYKCTDYDKQTYDIYRDADGGTYEATLRKDGTWVLDGDPLRHGQRFWLGHRSVYQNPSF